MTDFEHDGWKVARGGRDHRAIGSVTLSTGTSVEVPCIVVNGSEDGPTFVVSGGTHGQELVGTGAVLALARSLDPASVHGTVVLLPAMNPLAVQNASYVSPQDGLNMASSIYWPGNPGGTITERLGAIIGGVLQKADVYVDVHGNIEPSAPMCMMFLEQSKDDRTTDEIRKLGDAFGVTPVDMSAPKAHPAMVGPVDGYPAAVQASRGVPALMIELTSNRTLANAERGASGLRNVMRVVGMLDGDPEPLGVERLPGAYQYYGALQTDVPGLLWQRRPPGDVVDADEVLLEVTDLFGERRGEISAPVQGFSWGYLGTPQGMANHAVAEGAIVGFYAEKVG
jgi:predicted deacylase